VCFIILAFAASNGPAYGDVADGGIAKGRIGVGLNYPGIGVKYFFTDRFSLEARGYYEKDIFLAGPRLSRYFGPITGVFPYIGVEADYVNFKGEVSEGSGIFGEVLIGGEYFFWKKTSVQFDFGPAYIFLKDKNYSVSVGGIEYVVNFGLNYYFGPGSKSTSEARLSPGYSAKLEKHEDILPVEVPLPAQTALDVDKEYRAATALYNSGDHDRAWRKAYAILKADPQHWKSWAMIGNCQYAKGDRQAALDSYQRALEIHPANPQLKAWTEKLRAQSQPSGG